MRTGSAQIEIIDEARQCYRLAAKQGDAGSKIQVGEHYDKGLGVKIDYTEAASGFNKPLMLDLRKLNSN